MNKKNDASEATSIEGGNILISTEDKDTEKSNTPKYSIDNLPPDRKRRDKANVPSDTRDESYLELLKSGTSQTQEAKIFSVLSKCETPKNSRELSALSGTERAAINRVIVNLRDAKAIYVAYKEPCKLTKRRVEHYAVVEGKTLENTTSSTPLQQTALFNGKLDPANTTKGGQDGR